MKKILLLILWSSYCWSQTTTYPTYISSNNFGGNDIGGTQTTILSFTASNPAGGAWRNSAGGTLPERYRSYWKFVPTQTLSGVTSAELTITITTTGYITCDSVYLATYSCATASMSSTMWGSINFTSGQNISAAKRADSCDNAIVVHFTLNSRGLAYLNGKTTSDTIKFATLSQYDFQNASLASSNAYTGMFWSNANAPTLKVTSALKPTVVTNPVTNASTTTAYLNGNVTSDGGSTVTERGFCWNTTGNPNIFSYYYGGGGTGTGTYSYVGNFVPNTYYYVKAWAINIVDTAYGDQVTFKTLGGKNKTQYIINMAR